MTKREPDHIPASIRRRVPLEIVNALGGIDSLGQLTVAFTAATLRAFNFDNGRVERDIETYTYLDKSLRGYLYACQKIIHDVQARRHPRMVRHPDVVGRLSCTERNLS